MNKILKRIFIILIILTVVAIFLIIQIKKQNSSNNIISEEDQKEIIENEIQTAKLENLSNKSEASRIKEYVGQFFTLIETKDYENAYNILFESFKQNYFKQQSDFEEYVKNKYPKRIVLNYDKLNREGKYYIATVQIIDAQNPENKFTQRVVVEEQDLNKFNVSFQVE